MLGRLQILAGGVAVSIVMSSAAYVKGRMDGWANYETAQESADNAQAAANAETYRADVAVNQQDGVVSAQIDDNARLALSETDDELSRTPGAIVCPSDPARGLLVDQAVSEANAALSAARTEFDAGAGGRSGAAADRDPDE